MQWRTTGSSPARRFTARCRRGLIRFWNRHLQPAALRAGITKWVGFHTFRHTYSTLLQANENDVKVVQELMRHANVTTTMNVYTQAITAKKRQAQSRVIDVLMNRSPRAEAATERMSA